MKKKKILNKNYKNFFLSFIVKHPVGLTKANTEIKKVLVLNICW